MKNIFTITIGIFACSSIALAQLKPSSLSVSKNYKQGTEYANQNNRTKITIYGDYNYSSRDIQTDANASFLLGRDNRSGHKYFDVGNNSIQSPYPGEVNNFRFKNKKTSLQAVAKVGDMSLVATFANEISLFFVNSIGGLGQWDLKEREANHTIPFEKVVGEKIIKLKDKDRAVILWSNPTKVIISIWDFKKDVDVFKTVNIDAEIIGVPKMNINKKGELLIAYQTSSGLNLLGLDLDESFTSKSFVEKWHVTIPELKNQILNDAIIDSKNRVVCVLNSKENGVTKIVQLSADHKTVHVGNVSYLNPKNWSRKHKKTNPIPNTTNKKINFDKQTDVPTAELKLIEKSDDGSYLLLACPSTSSTEYSIPVVKDDHVIYRNEKHANDNIFLINIDNTNLLPYSWDAILAEKYKDEYEMVFTSSELSERYEITEFSSELSADKTTGDYLNKLTIIRAPMDGFESKYYSRDFTVRLKLNSTNGIDKTQAYKAKYEDAKKLDGPENYYTVKKGDRWGVVDSEDNIIIPIEYYSYIPYFPEYKAFRVEKVSNSGYVGLDNKTIIDFNHGMGYAESGIVKVNYEYNSKCYYEDLRTGKRLYPKSFKDGEDFKGDKAKVTLKLEDGTIKTGYLYLSGKLVFD